MFAIDFFALLGIVGFECGIKSIVSVFTGLVQFNLIALLCAVQLILTILKLAKMKTTEKSQTSRLQNLLSKSNYLDKTFTPEFNAIIESKIYGYSGTKEQQLKAFFEDLQRGGCSSGIIGDFIYHHDCKNFYIAHIDDLEEMREEIEEQLGGSIDNRNKYPHYTFMCWLCFEEYCYDLYRTLFEQ